MEFMLITEVRLIIFQTTGLIQTTLEFTLTKIPIQIHSFQIL